MTYGLNVIKSVTGWIRYVKTWQQVKELQGGVMQSMKNPLLSFSRRQLLDNKLDNLMSDCPISVK